MKSDSKQEVSLFRAGWIGAKIIFLRALRGIASSYYDPGLQDEIDAYFEAQSGTSEAKPPKRTRSDAIKTAMNAYLDKCKAESKKPDIDECWRFTAERQGIEENHNGNLSYPIRAGKKVKEVNRKHFSDRLWRLLRER